ncbi:uncharacterized protein EV154DRAFT_576621 [Mucor mucedo]|uniref:uncharacterized protein n=1 Tax=Mucor mucedo TaxID=29922 RepID=UPI00221E798E|nr:uncharacterized protein EV154DRAFT_576621 [Mucor mucedo]KAI7894804.1 hypothetical protein EV154DRAFT_576621 [Mucor mucedo]
MVRQNCKNLADIDDTSNTGSLIEDLDFIVGVSQFKKSQFQNALECFEKSLDKCGDSEAALLFAATILYIGLEVQRDAVRAYTLFDRALLFDSAIAQYVLGLMCRYGDGVEGDYKKSIEWFILSARLGCSAQHIQNIYHLVEPSSELDDTMFWYNAMTNASNDDDESVYEFDQHMELLFTMIRRFEDDYYIKVKGKPIRSAHPKANKSFVQRIRHLWYKLKRAKQMVSC